MGKLFSNRLFAVLLWRGAVVTALANSARRCASESISALWISDGRGKERRLRRGNRCMRSSVTIPETSTSLGDASSREVLRRLDECSHSQSET